MHTSNQMVNIRQSRICVKYTFHCKGLNHISINYFYSLLTTHSLNFIIKLGRTLRIYYNQRHRSVKKILSSSRAVSLLTYL